MRQVFQNTQRYAKYHKISIIFPLHQDIIGSNRFKEPLAILADRIERLKDIRLEKLARVKAVEKEKNELETVKDEAVAYLRLLNKMTRIKNVIYQKNQHQEASNESRYRSELVKIEQQVEVIHTFFEQNLFLYSKSSQMIVHYEKVPE